MWPEELWKNWSLSIRGFQCRSAVVLGCIWLCLSPDELPHAPLASAWVRVVRLRIVGGSPRMDLFTKVLKKRRQYVESKGECDLIWVKGKYNMKEINFILLKLHSQIQKQSRLLTDQRFINGRPVILTCNSKLIPA